MADDATPEMEDSVPHDVRSALPPTARDVLDECSPVDSRALTRQVLELFAARPVRASLPVVDGCTGRPIGLINQGIFMTSMAKPYYKEIFLDRSCLVFMDKEPMVVDVDTPLEQVSLWIAAGGDKVVADGFVVTERGRYLGLGYAQDVLRAMAEVHRKHSTRLARHQDELEELVLERTRELTIARDAAEEAARAKSAFLANMSHEIRTPMNAIMGMTHLMKRDGLPPHQAERLVRIETAANHLLGLVNDILDLSKIGAGEMTLVKQPLDLGDVVHGVAALMAPLAYAKGLTLTVEASGTPGHLVGDATRLRQALLNYVANAVKFTQEGGIVIRYGVVADHRDRVTVRIDVRDTGIGIAADVLPHLFTAFRQADQSTTRRFGGTGLGLAITRHLSELMGGDAGADSTPGRGSTFWFSAVLERAGHERKAAGHQVNQVLRMPAAVRDALQELRLRHAGARVLVAEDEPINQELAFEFLADAGLHVEVVGTGKAAAERARSGRYALILMDMQMPEMDGVEATRAIRTESTGEDVVIVAMTANAFAKDREQCLAAGMDDFLSKPVEPELLYGTVLRWLDRQKADGAQAYG